MRFSVFLSPFIPIDLNFMLNQAPLYSRFWQYLRERFPLHSHGILIAAFGFSAIGYSRVSRDVAGFIPFNDYLICIFNTITLFFLLRVFDEHKDAKEDALYRQELPVPRGLISLKELRNIAWVVFVLQCLVTALTLPQMLPLYAMVIGYLLLMGKEFFVAEWLKKRQFWYVTSHMLIIPLVDVYASGYDWYLEGSEAPFGLIFFFGVSFMNGIVLELGRKIRAPHDEKPGVDTYSAMLGLTRALRLWVLVLFFTLILALGAAHYAHAKPVVSIALIVYFCLTLWAAIHHHRTQTTSSAKWVEQASGLWTILMYLTLGGVLTFMQWI